MREGREGGKECKGGDGRGSKEWGSVRKGWGGKGKTAVDIWFGLMRCCTS